MRFLCSLFILNLAFASQVLAKRSSELIYTEPFDLAAGGTTLTRASQEGIVFANPALLPLGAAYIRWLGLQTGVMIDRDLAESGSTRMSDAAGAGESNFVDQLFGRSLHFGQTTTLSFLNQNLAITAFNRFEVDVAGRRFGDAGLPTIDFAVEAYAGALTSLATRPWRWLSLGLTAKHLYVAEPTISVPIADQTRVRELVENPNDLRDEVKIGKGTGADVGALFLWQNHSLDLSLGLKVEDLGATKLSGTEESIPQTVHAGVGVAWHGTTEVLHLSLDFRDVLGAYAEEKTFKKVYVGARVMVRQMLGLAVGLYQGIPSFGVRMDLFLFKLGLTAYGRELGDYPGEKQRNMVTIYTSLGF